MSRRKAWSRPGREGSGCAAANGSGITITVYQPQLESFEADQLTGRAAVAVENQASPTPTYGVIWFSARAEINVQAGTVALDEFKITRSSLPAPAAGAADPLQV